MEYGKTVDHGFATSLSEDLVTSHSVSLSGLESNTTYHYRAKSTDAIGNEATSEDETFTTSALPDTTPPGISEVTASGIIESSATITWTTDEAATSQVEYGENSDYGSTTSLDESLVTSHSVSLSGLEPNTTYHYRVKSKDSFGNEAVSDDDSFATPDTPPNAPSGLDAIRGIQRGQSELDCQ